MTISRYRPRAIAMLCVAVAACFLTAACHTATAGAATNPPSSASPGSTDAAESAASPASTAPAATAGTGAATASGGTDAGVGTGKPCALLTESDAAGTAGEPLHAGVASVQGTFGTCVFKSGNDSAFVAITVGNWADLKVVPQRRSATPVSGLGDEAWTFTDAAGCQLFVRTGDTGFRLLIHGPNIDKLPDVGLAKERSLATLILSRA